MIKIQIEEHKDELKVKISEYKVSENETKIKKLLLTEIIEDVITKIIEK